MNVVGPNGAIQGFLLNGVPTGVNGTATLVDEDKRIFSVDRTDGIPAILMMSADKQHLLYIDQNHQFGAWQKEATSLAPPYAMPDILGSGWTGTTATVQAPFAYGMGEPLASLINGGAAFTETSQTLVTSTGAQPPITVLDGTNGQYEGGFTTDGSPPDTGPALMLLTPDRKFLAIQYAWGSAFPDNVRYSAWQRDP